MSYQVLARKWRPSNFNEMVGQAHVLRALSSALDNERLHHAYLFTGTRGVGKTTIARILARCLNCDEGISSTPCGTCSACNEINEGRFVDLIEVDAASRTGIDDTKELLENVQYSPTRGRYKIYLIDEVHMLSRHSFNALLKTLEEPPPHVVFLLATTDPQKLPATVLSRCLQFHLKNMQPNDISNHLAHILETESTEFETAALESLAWSAKGSMRDGLSLLDQAIAYGDGKVMDADVREMLGSIDRGQVYQILSAVAANDGAKCMAIIEDLTQFSPDYEDVLAELLSVLHRVALIQQIPDASLATQDQQQIEQLANSIAAEDVQLFYQLALHGRRDIPLAPDKRSGFEMCMLRLMNFRPADTSVGVTPVKKPESSLQKTVETADVASDDVPYYEELQTASTELVTSPIKSPLVRDQPSLSSKESTEDHTKKPTEKLSVELVANLTEEPDEVIIDSVPIPDIEVGLSKQTDVVIADAEFPTINKINQENWYRVIEQATITGVTEQMALNSQFISLEGENIKLSLNHHVRSMLNPEHINKLTAAINALYNSSFTMTITDSEPEYETPRQRKERIQAERHKVACDNLNDDKQVQSLLKTFEANLDSDSVVTLLPE